MSILALYNDAAIVAASASGDDRAVRYDFVERRVRQALADHPDWASGDSLSVITEAATPGLVASVTAEITAAAAAHTRVAADLATDTAHLSLEPGEIARRVTSRTPVKSPKLMRARLIRTIVFQAVAERPARAADTQAARPVLAELVDRRLRIAERMLYSVGSVDRAKRTWAKALPTTAGTSPAAPWTDGFIRTFEYPRIPQRVFLGACNPDPATGICRSAGLTRDPAHPWARVGADNLIKDPDLRFGIAGWGRNAADGYRFDYTGPTTGVAAAIDDVFQESTDFNARNHLFCDQVIHALHLEALRFARQRAGAPDTWLDAEWPAPAAGAAALKWLRIRSALSADPSGTDPDEVFLASPREPRHFEFKEVQRDDLQVGDHLIVYNHPAFDHVAPEAPWRLENCIVVQTVPGLRLQGHGISPLTQGGVWNEMLRIFNRQLDDRRKQVLATGDPAQLPTMWGRPRIAIAGVDDAFLVRRVAPAQSALAANRRHADWWVAWHGRDREVDMTILTDPLHQAQRALAKEIHRVEYTEEREGMVTMTVGWLPLWEPARDKRGDPVTNAAHQISAVADVKMGPENIAGWTWFLPTDPAKRDLVPVVRPKAD